MQTVPEPSIPYGNPKNHIMKMSYVSVYTCITAKCSVFPRRVDLWPSKIPSNTPILKAPESTILRIDYNVDVYISSERGEVTDSLATSACNARC